MTETYGRDPSEAERGTEAISQVDPSVGTSAEAVSLNAVSVAADALDQSLHTSAAQERDQLERSDASNRVEQRRQVAETSYDTRDRRDRMETELDERGIDHEVVAARVRADMSQAKPATVITRAAPTRQSQAVDLRGGQQRSQHRQQEAQRQGTNDRQALQR